jgi:DNA-binding transcriptional LysR family regulator
MVYTYHNYQILLPGFQKLAGQSFLLSLPSLMSVHNQLQETSLRYFYEVVRCGSLSEASTRLHVAVSAISRQITLLETALGTALFERRPRGMAPTPAGELLAAHVRRLGLETERVIEDIQALQGLQRGTVRIASSEGFAIEFLPNTITQFRKQYQGISFKLDVSAPAEVTAKVRQGDCDIGLTFSRQAEKDIRVEHRQPAPVLVLMQPDHPLAVEKSVTLAQLLPYPLALPTVDTTLRQVIDIACSREQLVLEPVLTSNRIESLYNFVLTGGGITLTGAVAAHRTVTKGAMVAIPLKAATIAMRDIELQTLVGRTLPAAVQTFIVYLKERLVYTSALLPRE